MFGDLTDAKPDPIDDILNEMTDGKWSKLRTKGTILTPKYKFTNPYGFEKRGAISAEIKSIQKAITVCKDANFKLKELKAPSIDNDIIERLKASNFNADSAQGLMIKNAIELGLTDNLLQSLDLYCHALKFRLEVLEETVEAVNADLNSDKIRNIYAHHLANTLYDVFVACLSKTPSYGTDGGSGGINGNYSKALEKLLLHYKVEVDVADLARSVIKTKAL